MSLTVLFLHSGLGSRIWLQTTGDILQIDHNRDVFKMLGRQLLMMVRLVNGSCACKYLLA